MPTPERKDCFVVMPFGIKRFTDVVSAPPNANAGEPVEARIRQIDIDFNRIYDKIIHRAVAELGLDCQRSDETKESGLVHRDMIRRIIDADVALVDITLENPNVFYELGVRHSLRRSTTVVIRHARYQTKFPFNIAGMRAIEYDDLDEERMQASIKRLRDAIGASFAGKDVDSLVHTLFNDILITRNAPPIMEKKFVEYEVAAAKGRYVGYITGDIARITECDAWVNAENTKMEMGRLHDDSISATIRYYGSRRTPLNEIDFDCIREDLLCQVDLHQSVEPGTVLITGPGELAQSNNVKVLLHVAALHGEPAKGYLPIRDYPGCILRVLGVVEEINSGRTKVYTRRRDDPKSWFRRRPADRSANVKITPVKLTKPIESIIIPLFGSRTSGQHPQDVSDQLFRAACVHFEHNPNAALKRVYFLAYTGSDQEYCEGALASLNRGKQHRLLERTERSVADFVRPKSANGEAARP